MTEIIDKIEELLPKEASALIWNDGQFALVIPHMEDDEEVPAHVCMMVALMARLQEEEYRDGLMDWLTKQAEKFEQDEQNEK